MNEKLENLKNYLTNFKRVVISYSGGLDSSLLLKIASDILGNEKVIAVIGVSPIHFKEEIKFAENFCKELKVKLIKIKTEELKNKNFIDNPPDRCFWCKKELFKKIEEIRKQYNFNYIIDGTNKDDEKDYRPGEKAKKFYNVLSPLKECGFKKKDIKKLSKELELPYYDRPSETCLATRIPYGEKITINRLKKIEKAEKYLKSLGFKIVRVRDYKNLARIEVEKNKIKKILEVQEKVLKRFKKIGYKYITIDLEGYRSGSMNKILRGKL